MLAVEPAAAAAAATVAVYLWTQIFRSFGLHVCTPNVVIFTLTVVGRGKRRMRAFSACTKSCLELAACSLSLRLRSLYEVY